MEGDTCAIDDAEDGTWCAPMLAAEGTFDMGALVGRLTCFDFGAVCRWCRKGLPHGGKERVEVSDHGVGDGTSCRLRPAVEAPFPCAVSIAVLVLDGVGAFRPP